MKIIFIRPFSIADEIIPPLNYGYLASGLSQKHDVIIFDQLRDKYSDDFLIKALQKEIPDVLGFSAFSKDISNTKSLMSKMRPLFPDTKFVLGGVQISVMPEETFKYIGKSIDYGFVGESEEAFTMLIEELDKDCPEKNLENIHNLIWSKHGALIQNKPLVVDNLDDLSFPRWDLMLPNSYPKAPHGAFLKQYPVAPIITSRGCSYPCTFCAASVLSGKKVRYRSILNVMEEIKYLNKNFEVKEIHIEDDNFSMKKDRVVEFSEHMLNLKLGISWAFPNGLRLDKLDFKTLKLMKRAGCYSINVGIESGNEEMLKKIRKNITKEMIKDNMSMVKDAGIDVGGFFIIGFPDETKEKINDTINFACEIRLDRIGVSYFQPYPGTSDYFELEAKKEYTFDINTSNHSLHTISYIPKTLTKKNLKHLRLKAFMRFYLRPKILFKLLSEIKDMTHFKFILKRALRWLQN